MSLIVLDSGHGGFDNGASYEGRLEKDENLAITLAVGEKLTEQGVDVIYTRTEDIYESPFEKAKEGNAAGADYFISFHRNASNFPNTFSGVESLIYDYSSTDALIMAENINAELEKVGFKNLGVKERPNLIVLNSTNMPAVLVEVGFINTEADNILFDEKFDEIATAIAEGILITLGK